VAPLSVKGEFPGLSNRATRDFPARDLVEKFETARASGYFNACAAALVDNGFTVTPTRGKNAFLARWQNPKPTDRVWLGKMLKANRYPGSNIGIVCGRVVVLDIDAENPAVAEQLVALAPPTKLGIMYDARIERDAEGRVIDGREALMTKITAAEYAADR
jgi:hypothetical protein